jgi:uncharacterized protein YpmS
MKNYRNLIILLSILAALAVAAIACNMPASIGQGPDNNPEMTPNTGSTQAGQLSTGSTSSDTVTITLTEGQINTIVQQALQSQTTQTIQGLQVRLEQGQVIVTGTVNQNGLSLPLRLYLEISPNTQGGLTYHIASASVGPFPLPEGMRSQIETMLNQNLQSQVNQLTNNMFIESINIGSGVMTVTGRLQ